MDLSANLGATGTESPDPSGSVTLLCGTLPSGSVAPSPSAGPPPAPTKGTSVAPSTCGTSQLLSLQAQVDALKASLARITSHQEETFPMEVGLCGSPTDRDPLVACIPDRPSQPDSPVGQCYPVDDLIDSLSIISAPPSTLHPRSASRGRQYSNRRASYSQGSAIPAPRGR